MPLFNLVLVSTLFLVLVSWVLVICGRYLMGLKVLLVAAVSMCNLGAVMVLPFLPFSLVYMVSFVGFSYILLWLVSFCLKEKKMKRCDMFDGWDDAA